MIIASYLLSAFLRAHVALAIPQSPIKPPKTISVGTDSGGVRLISFACLGLRWLFTAAIIYSIVMALLAAIHYMKSAGDPAKVKESTHKLVYAAIGVAVALGARSLPVLVGSLLSVAGGTDIGTLCR